MGHYDSCYDDDVYYPTQEELMKEDIKKLKDKINTLEDKIKKLEDNFKEFKEMKNVINTQKIKRRRNSIL